jgi:hypothetical protein
MELPLGSAGSRGFLPTFVSGVERWAGIQTPVASHPDLTSEAQVTRAKAIETVVETIQAGLANAPISRQIEIYEALSEVMPTEPERNRAMEIATTLAEVEKLQLDFSKQLFAELRWPGHQHNGPKKGDGHNS